MENVSKTTKKPVNKKKVLYVAAECKGFMTTGGLAEVAGSLPKGIHMLAVQGRWGCTLIIIIMHQKML